MDESGITWGSFASAVTASAMCVTHSQPVKIWYGSQPYQSVSPSFCHNRPPAPPSTPG
uniref:Uncharacterized protein n=1 Tax=uncultured marine virus TaxID=186617 RepID=A0A0F7L6L1_9VIRU|nr:hypothetical protein [uncultured marine virus]